MTTKRYIYSTPTGLLNGRVDISILRFEVKFGLYFKMPFRCPTKGEYLNRLPAVAKLKFAARYPSLFLINLFPGTLGKGRILLPLNLCISRRELLQAR
jgi:hypothetical protein